MPIRVLVFRSAKSEHGRSAVLRAQRQRLWRKCLKRVPAVVVQHPLCTQFADSGPIWDDKIHSQLQHDWQKQEKQVRGNYGHSALKSQIDRGNSTRGSMGSGAIEV